MITSLRLYKHVNVGVGSTGKFQIAGNNEIFNTKEIPAVRYKFDAYTQDDADFIKKMEETFKHSVHVIEVSLLDAAEVVPMIKETICTDLFQFLEVALNSPQQKIGCLHDSMT